ncbi:ATP-binding protein [Streptomyces mayteni]
MLDQLGQPFPPVDLRTLSGTATLGLTQRPESVRRAREFTRSTLMGWRIPEHFDSVGLVVSELVTNALRHGVGPRPTAGSGGGVPSQSTGQPAAAVTVSRPLVELELMRCARRLICAVQDPSGALPRTSQPGGMDGSAESGRGLHLVECFSDGWGWRMLTSGRGKVVWAVFQTD